MRRRSGSFPRTPVGAVSKESRGRNILRHYISSVRDNISIEVMPSNDLRAEVIANDTSNKEGHILIRTSSNFDSSSRVVVLVTDGEKVIMRSLAIQVVPDSESAQLYIYNGATKNVSKNGGEVTLTFLSNIDCQAVIPEEAASWISPVQTRALTRQSIVLNVAANISEPRSAKVKVQSLDGALWVEYTIMQFGGTGSVNPDIETPADNQIFYTSSDGNIITPSDSFGAIIISNTYSDGRGVIIFDRDLTRIGSNAFQNCTTLTSIVIPNKIAYINSNSFKGCSNLTSINLPEGLTNIGNSAFYNCKKLTNVTLPNSVANIGSSVFYNCESLTEITIPYGVTEIGSDTFEYCDNLTDVTLPISITKIASRAFGSCSNLTNINLPERLTSIGSNAFSGCKNLTNIVIPDNVTAIGFSAFSGCNALDSVTIGSKVEVIGETAFANCNFLRSIYCKAIVPPQIYEDSFYGFKSTIYVPEYEYDIIVNKYKAAEGWKAYANQIVGYNFGNSEGVAPKPANNEIWYSATAKVEPYWKDAFGATLVSNTFNEETGTGIIVFASDVTEVGKNAFYSNEELISITLPNSVKIIGEQAFRNCNRLERVKLGNSVTTIGNYAFAYCKLVEINIPDSVTSIGERAFESCDFSTITLGNGLKTIGTFAFCQCSQLISITIPDSVTTIGDGCFYSCNQMTHVTIGKGVTTIGDYAFRCDKIERFIGKFAKDNGRCLIIDNVIIAYASASGNTYTIPDGVTRIGSAFISSNLESITIPHSVTSITKSAFSGCSKLKYIYCKPITPPTLYNDTFSSTPNDRRIYVHPESFYK